MEHEGEKVVKGGEEEAQWKIPLPGFVVSVGATAVVACVNYMLLLRSSCCWDKW